MSVIGRASRFVAGGQQRVYATWNPSDKAANVTLSGGNLTMAVAGATYDSVRSTISKNSGKHYWEYLWNSGTNAAFGVADATLVLAGNWPGDDTHGWSVFSLNGFNYTGNSAVSDAFGGAFSPVKTIGVALDLDSGSVRFYLNNVAATNALSITGSPTVFACVGSYNSANNITANFGATAFTYTPPGGYRSGLYTGP